MHSIANTLCFTLAIAALALPATANELPPPAAETLAPPPAESQPDTRGPARRNHERGTNPSTYGDSQKSREMRALFEQVMIARLSHELELDDAQTILLVRRIGEVKEKAAQIRKERAKALRDLQELLTNDRDNRDIAPTLNAIMQADEELIRLRREAYDKAAEGLSDWQRARLYTFLQEFDSEMRRLIERARSRAHNDPDTRDESPTPQPETNPGRNRADRTERPDRPPRNRPNADTPPPPAE